MKNFNKKLAVSDDFGGWKLRVFHRKRRGLKMPRFLVKCGCCDETVEIWYDDHGLEINGVCASKEEWQKLLRPLLK